jgi:hypothetical protein
VWLGAEHFSGFGIADDLLFDRIPVDGLGGQGGGPGQVANDVATDGHFDGTHSFLAGADTIDEVLVVLAGDRQVLVTVLKFDPPEVAVAGLKAAIDVSDPAFGTVEDDPIPGFPWLLVVAGDGFFGRDGVGEVQFDAILIAAMHVPVFEGAEDALVRDVTGAFIVHRAGMIGLVAPLGDTEGMDATTGDESEGGFRASDIRPSGCSGQRCREPWARVPTRYRNPAGPPEPGPPRWNRRGRHCILRHHCGRYGTRHRCAGFRQYSHCEPVRPFCGSGPGTGIGCRIGKPVRAPLTA